MRFHLCAALVLASAAIPASAQDARNDRRVEKLEQEIRALQRRVFLGGSTVQPEIAGSTQGASTSGVPASSVVSDLTARLDAIENQLATLTGQVEENANRISRLETSLPRFQRSAEARLDALERARTAAEPPASSTPRPGGSSTTPRPIGTGTTSPADTPAAAPPPDPAEQAYNAGFRLWEQKRYPEAQRALEAVGRQYPRSKWASWANNLAGRAYLDEGKPATAAKTFLANYQGNPRGERAADSLYFLGQSLARLGKPAEACKVYDELQDVYGGTMRTFISERLPQARTDARCAD